MVVQRSTSQANQLSILFRLLFPHVNNLLQHISFLHQRKWNFSISYKLTIRLHQMLQHLSHFLSHEGHRPLKQVQEVGQEIWMGIF